MIHPIIILLNGRIWIAEAQQKLKFTIDLIPTQISIICNLKINKINFRVKIKFIKMLLYYFQQTI